MKMGVELAERLRLAPELRRDVNVDELASYFGAPILLCLKNGNWVLFLGTRTQVSEGGVSPSVSRCLIRSARDRAS